MKRTNAVMILILMIVACIFPASAGFGSGTTNDNPSVRDTTEVVNSMTSNSDIVAKVAAVFSKAPIQVAEDADLVDEYLPVEEDISETITAEIDTDNLPSELVDELKYILHASNNTPRITPFQTITWLVNDLKEMGILNAGVSYAIGFAKNDWLTPYIAIPMDDSEDYDCLVYHLETSRSGNNGIKVVRIPEKIGQGKGKPITVYAKPIMYKMS